MGKLIQSVATREHKLNTETSITEQNAKKLFFTSIIIEFLTVIIVNYLTGQLK